MDIEQNNVILLLLSVTTSYLLSNNNDELFYWRLINFIVRILDCAENTDGDVDAKSYYYTQCARSIYYEELFD